MAEDLFTLQQEALRRAREMHSRASPLHTPQPQQQRQQQQQPPQQPINANDHKQVHNNKENTIQEKPPDLLEALFKDKDKTIILALLILLSGENGDNSLLFALMYLLM